MSYVLCGGTGSGVLGVMGDTLTEAVMKLVFVVLCTYHAPMIVLSMSDKNSSDTNLSAS